MFNSLWAIDISSPPFFLVVGIDIVFWHLNTISFKKRHYFNACIQMSEYFNQKSGLSGAIPLGSFNAMFNFSGNWQADASSTKSLAMAGYFIRLYRLQLSKLQLALNEHIKGAVPCSWDPAALARQVDEFSDAVI